MLKKNVLRYPIFLAIILMSIIIFSPFTTVKAVSYYDFEKESWLTVEVAQKTHLAHSSGKFVYVYFDAGTKKIEGIILQSDGTFFGEFEHLTPEPTYCYGLSQRIMIMEIDNDEFIIFQANPHYSAGVNHIYSYRYNINTLALIAERDVEPWYGGGTSQNFTSIDSVWYDDKIYIFTAHMQGSAPLYNAIEVAEYDVSTNTFTLKQRFDLTATASAITLGYLHAYQYDYDLNLIFIVVATKPTPETPKFYIYDIDDDSWEYQAQFPISGRYNTSPRFWWIDSGTRLLGNDIYVYFTWASTKLVGQTNTVYLIQHRLIYNLTVQASNLTAQNSRTIILFPTITDVNPVSDIWTMGYNDDENASDYMLFHEIQTFDSDNDYWVGELWELSAFIPDWFNTGIGAFTQNHYQTSDEEIYSYPRTTARDASVYDILWTDFTSQWQSANKQQNPKVRIWSGLIPPLINYDMGFVVTPDESPKVVNRNYRMTITTTGNGIAFRTTLIIYLDNVQTLASATEINGQKVITFLFATEGIHTITVKMYQYTTTNFLYEEDYEDIWSLTGAEPDEPTAGLLIPLTVAGISIFMPIFFIVLVPMFALGEMAGKIGIMAGLVIGVTIGAVSGLLPMYTVFLMILITVLAFVFLIRGGRF